MINKYINKTFDCIVRHRTALMGISILWIFFMHSGNLGIPIWDSIMSYGWMGVDIFIFLSSIGLCFSLDKNSDLHQFYMRRALRIIPTWLSVLFIIHILGCLVCHFAPQLPFHYPHNLLQCILWYTGIGYWINFILINPLSCYYEWYIPTLLLFYFITPYVYKQSFKVTTLMLIATTIFSLILTSTHTLYSLHLSYQRLPVFILGVWIYKCINTNTQHYTLIYLIISSIVSLTIIILYDANPLDVYIKHLPLCLLPFGVSVLALLVETFKLSKIFSVFGIISLELYLIHLYNRPNFLVSLFVDLSPISNTFITLALCTLVAHLLHYVMNYCHSYLRKCFTKDV